MIEDVPLPGRGKGVADVSLERTDGLLDPLLMWNKHNPMEVIRHSQHHQWSPFTAGSKVIGGRKNGRPGGRIIEVADFPFLMA